MALEQVLQDLQNQISELKYQLEGLRKIEKSGLGIDGWIKLGINPVYVSSTSIRFDGVDFTRLFPSGTKIKFTQTTEKYFYVIGTSYSGGNTSLTLNGGSDYTVANAAISYFAYAHGLAKDFPDWFNYTLSWTSSGTAPSLGNAVYSAKYRMQGRFVHLEIRLTMGSTTTYGTGNWYFNNPFAITAYDSIGGGHPGFAHAFDASTSVRYLGNAMLQSSTQIICSNPASANFYSSSVPMTWVSTDILWIVRFIRY